MTRPLAFLLLGTALGAAPAIATAQGPLRYGFEPGLQIHYAGQTESQASYGATTSKVDWRFFVHREDDDGSFRIYIQRSTKTERTLQTGKKMDFPANDSWGWVDMRPDGTFTNNPSLALGLDPSVVFPPLAPDADQQKAGWVCAVPMFDRQYTVTLLDDALVADVDSPSHRNYLRRERIEARIDADVGLPARITEQTEGRWNARNTSATTLALQTREIGAAVTPFTAADAADLDRYFAAREQYDRLTFRGRTEPDHKDALLAKALAAVRGAREQVTTATAQGLLDKLIAGHDGRIRYVDTYAELFAKVMNKPSPEWTAPTLDGAERSLADYRGKVVVLDFWYRGCGWCVRAMPQMNELAAHYASMPVAILGVNKDANLADARFTVRAVDLRYDNLHSKTMPELYGVRGYPTLVVLDKQGVVRDIHIGYSPTLRAELTEVIDRLLGEVPNPESFLASGIRR